MERVNNENINSAEYWDQIYAQERRSGKRRIDDERLLYVVNQAKDNWQYHPTEDPLFLDVGCGDGEFLRFFHAYLPTWKKYGVDITPKTIDFARLDNPGMQFRTANVDDLPFEPIFDVVFMGETLEHLERPEEAIEQLFKVTKPGGYVIISTPNEHANYSPEHIHEFTIGEVIAMMEKYGKVKYHDIRAVCNGISQIITAVK